MSENEIKSQEVEVTDNAAKIIVDQKEVKSSKKQSFEGRVKKSAKDELTDAIKLYPAHLINLVRIIKNNAEIRRFTSIGILNYLLQKGEISGSNRYVSYKWNKFSVNYNGLIREFLYIEPFFINCLVASFTSFSAAAQKTINIFCKKETVNGGNGKYIDKDEVEAIIEANNTHCNNE